MAWSTEHRTMSAGQRNFSVFLSIGHRTVSHRPNHEITVSSRENNLEQCLSDQVTNEKCP
jgi:hypothetical protein